MPKPCLPLLTLILFTPLAWAQDDDAARRAERAASNPMRMIIEAAKIKPKARAPEAARPAEPARPAESPRAAPRPVAEAAPAADPGSAQPPVPTATAVPVSTPVAAAAPEAPAAPVVDVAPAPSGPPESAVATVEVSATPRSDSLLATLPPAAEPEPVALKLASVVEPEMPRRLIGKVRGEVQVHVAFTVQADGRVADAAVRRSSHPTMDAAILEAVRQWRYEPIAAARPHEVQLVLRAPE
jgi:TonB family protein